MIEWTRGNIFSSKCQLLVNPVNCMGPMGAGLAKKFAERYPGLEKAHRLKCKTGVVKPGYLWIFDQKTPHVLNFPTKIHWRDPSQASYIISGLQTLRRAIMERQWASVKSIALPPLGCGLGGLDWNLVKDLVDQYLGQWSGTVEVYCPATTSSARTQTAAK